MPLTSLAAPALNAQDPDLPVIEVKHLTKEYRLGALEGLRALAGRLTGRAVPSRARYKALDDINFEIRRGEVVGIIGHNGAGKSTLLKHICRITTPTSGTVTVRGRVAPLIEVGAGLVGEMTGRENIYLNATILGLTRKEIDAKLDEIIAFSELEPFIDTPIKRYSSGMQVRLGFSIATTIESEILIVDEVLAVGDLNFQRKCLERVESLIKREGRTVLIVGHNIRQLERVCKRMILLAHGQVLADGPANIVTNQYFDYTENMRLASLPKTKVEVSGGGVELDKIELLSVESGTPTDKITLHDSLRIRLTLHCEAAFPEVDIHIGFHTLDFFQISTFNTAASNIEVNLAPGITHVDCVIPDVPLLPGLYGIRVGVIDQYGRGVWYAENVTHIHVVTNEQTRTRMSLYAVVDLPVQWAIDTGSGAAP
ncbi:MAG: ABC transporter ATP-binding protein [Pseudomonadota bacterium]